LTGDEKMELTKKQKEDFENIFTYLMRNNIKDYVHTTSWKGKDCSLIIKIEEL
jgi:hypothetical protein